MIIRQERPEEYETIYKLVKKAFETAPVTDGDEQDYVNALRASERYIPQFALVAEENGSLIGHIMLTKTLIESGTQISEELLLSPVCVALPFRKRGVGGALIQESFRLAKEAGYSAVFLCGDPAYYARFGFRATSDFGILNKGNIPQQYVMACELFPNALQNRSGTINIV